MNPVLLKPESTTGAQIIVQGKRLSTMTARDFFSHRAQFKAPILESFHRLAQGVDVILVEGAGSPAEVNLRKDDLANMGFALAAKVPAILIGDIHRGGVIASILGTFAVLDQNDRNLIKGFIINKFHGDPDLFSEGVSYLKSRTITSCLGIVPHFPDAAKLPAEDAVALEDRVSSTSKGMKICVLKLPRIANFDDLDPLRQEPGVAVSFLDANEPIPGDIDLVIIPGSKSTISDLAALRANGWDIDLAAHVRRGGHVLGLCGGYQMLGRLIHDPKGLEGISGTVAGLGLLDVETTLLPRKTTVETEAVHALTGAYIKAYQIHLGQTFGPDTARLFAQTPNGPDGAMSPDHRVMGTYLHGCFAQDEFRKKFLGRLGHEAQAFSYEQTIEDTLNALAAHLERNLELDRILALAEPVR